MQQQVCERQDRIRTAHMVYTTDLCTPAWTVCFLTERGWVLDSGVWRVDPGRVQLLALKRQPEDLQSEISWKEKKILYNITYIWNLYGASQVVQWQRIRLSMQETQDMWVWSPVRIPSLPGEGNGNLIQYSCPENPMDKGAWQATIHGVSKSWIQLSTHAHMESRKARAYFQSRNWDTTIKNGHVDTGEGVVGVGWIWRMGLTYTQPGIKQVMNDNLLYRQGTFLSAMWSPKREGNPQKRGCVYKDSWST